MEASLAPGAGSCTICLTGESWVALVVCRGTTTTQLGRACQPVGSCQMTRAHPRPLPGVDAVHPEESCHDGCTGQS